MPSPTTKAESAPTSNANSAAANTASPQPPIKDKIDPGAIEWIKAVGMPLATLIVTLLGGYFFTNLTKTREARESNERLYAQLLTNREQSDAAIRKDMFSVVINSFLVANKTAGATKVDEKTAIGRETADMEDKVLKLELLANNFSETLDLAPLFKDLARRAAVASASLKQQDSNLSETASAGLKRIASLTDRLDRTAANVIFRQVQSLSRHGYTEYKTESLEALSDWNNPVSSQPIIAAPVLKNRLVPSTMERPVSMDEKLYFSLEVLDVHFERREVDVRLRITFPGHEQDDVDRNFTVGPYDFPMLDNTQLRDGLRAAVVMTEFKTPNAPDRANSFVTLHLVVFPAASASYKERQDYDEILLDMLRAENQKRTL